MGTFRENNVKYTGVYRCPDEISNFIIRVCIKELESANIDLNHENQTDGEVAVLRWQQKIFSRFEKDFYRDAKNCVTDLEKTYNEEVCKLTGSDDKNVLFTYTNCDDFVLNENDEINNANETVIAHEDDRINAGYDFVQSLSRAVENDIGKNAFEFMYLMADLGEYVDGSWIKNEHVLCVIKYDKRRKVLSIYPDFTQRDPYFFQIHDDMTRNFLYHIVDVSEKMSDDALLREEVILNKIALQQRKVTENVGGNFELPRKDMLNVHLFFEILWAKEFEYGDIYVQYFIELPKNWDCNDPGTLQGVTQSCRTKNEDGIAHFGFTFEVVLEYDVKQLEEADFPRTPYIYFEVISKDTWRRYRTEGLAYKNLPVSRPGVYTCELQCFRFRPKGRCGNLRRFFIGDCSNYDDITWIGLPKEHDKNVLCKFGVNTVGTGRLGVKMSVVQQSQIFMNDVVSTGDGFVEHEKFIYEKLSSSRLFKSVQEVLEAFQNARKNMIEAKKQC